jgi:hypothetical protein
VMPMSSCNVTFENVYLYHACRLINPLVSSNSSYHRYLSYVEIKEKSYDMMQTSVIFFNQPFFENLYLSSFLYNKKDDTVFGFQ